MKVAVIVDPYSSGNMLAPAFREAGLIPVAVVSTPIPPAVCVSSYQPEDFHTIITHRGDLAETVEATRRMDPVCIVPGAECGVELADLLASRITPHRANVPKLAAARRHKGAMREALAIAGVPGVRQICTDSVDAVAKWLDHEGLIGRDLIVKPPKSTGTDGVTLVPSGQDWRPAFIGLLHQRNKAELINDQVIVQERLIGTEYVVDTFSHDGVHSVVDICRYRKRGTVYDSMEWMPYDLTAHGELVGYTRVVLDALGVRFGAAHSEVMMTSDGPRLIETNIRPHGAGQPRFCRIATGDSQVDRTVRYVAGGEVPDDFELRRHLLVVFLTCPATGVVRNMEIFDRLCTLPSYHFSSVAVRNGDRVQAPYDLFSSLAFGFVVLAHERETQVHADYAAIRELERDLIVEGP